MTKYDQSCKNIDSFGLKRKSIPNLDGILFLITLMTLIIYGLVSMYSASYPQAVDFNLNQTYFLVNQTKFAFLALLSGGIILIIPEKILRNVDYLLLGICFILMLLTLFTSFGLTRLGGRRWLQIGSLPAFQPSELVKISIVLFLSNRFKEIDDENRTKIYLICWSVVLLFAVLILAQKDFSTTAIFLVVCLTMFLFSGMKFDYVIIICLFLIVLGSIVVLSEPYRVKRIAAFLFPNLDPSGINYQVLNAGKAISSGGWFGKGLGQGIYKNGLIPEVQNDFIFSNIGEETGFFGILFIFGLFGMFAYLGYKASWKIKNIDPFFSLTCFGFTTMIIYQSLANIAVVVGVLPPTGIVLPFFSQGGTNLFVVILESSFIYRVIRISDHNQKSINGPDFDYRGVDADIFLQKDKV
ncbi:MAG: putative peptidoglycan glycosyltransferase FtsW [Sphaerochaetaceae bacterium]